MAQILVVDQLCHRLVRFCTFSAWLFAVNSYFLVDVNIKHACCVKFTTIVSKHHFNSNFDLTVCFMIFLFLVYCNVHFKNIHVKSLLLDLNGTITMGRKWHKLEKSSVKIYCGCILSS